MATAKKARAASSAGDVPPRKWLPVEDAAAWCGMAPDTLALYARTPGTPIRRKRQHTRGSKHLYNVASLDAWIESWEDA
ncbi:hypothetical protein F9L07_28365 [Pimelobacter simplex]|uniref:Helix-turn-helix domain-containing protein n=1 Tax=Nocardioides simplex TaxID=2045 RepID=A0A7J5DQJ6_NOCSI|nr:hypothetical protein [Pimelobacter simplex]KAB2806949.1 hypothetical protein F9L07_28365 [Pimelobacter simplex]